MSSVRVAADLAAVLDRDDPLAMVARELLSLEAEMADVNRIGTPLQDAALNPQAAELLPPTNAGAANPHGPLVAAIEIDDERRHAAIEAFRGGV